jgi:hypothetical protein
LHDHVLAARDRPVGSADPGEFEEAVVRDVSDHHPDLVPVTCEDHVEVAVADRRDCVTVRIRAGFAGEPRDVVEPGSLSRRLEARRGRGRQEVVQERPVSLVHDRHCGGGGINPTDAPAQNR